MLKNFRHRARNFIDRMANNPVEASRAVFAGLLIVGIFSLSLNLGPRIAPEFFETRLLDPLDRETLKTAREMDEENNELEEKLELIETCHEARVNNDYKTFLENFENSFAGILPGAGNLLPEYPATVNNRREKLIFEMMKNYAELKFCIPSDQFKVIYLADYRNVLKELNFFFQVFLVEEYPDKYSIDKINDVFLNMAAREYILVEKDLISTQKYVAEVIDRAIESAIELDQQTQIRVANLTKQTSNFLLNTLVAQENQNIEINTSAAFLLEAIRNQDASENPYGGTTSRFTEPTAYDSEIQTPQIPTGDSGISDKRDKAIPPKVSFGLLNLLAETEREDFLANHYAIEMAFYLAAKYSFDPLTPEGNALTAAGILEYDRTVYEGQMIRLFETDISVETSGDHVITTPEIQSIPTQTNSGDSSTNTVPWPDEPAPINIQEQELDVVDINIRQQSIIVDVQ